MKFGAALPITAISDPVAVRECAQTLDDAGFDVLTSAGHVLAVPAERYTDRPALTYAGPFHDPFVVFAYLAAITKRLHFRSSILILPAYPATLVAKQAAELQFLSGGRFELGSASAGTRPNTRRSARILGRGVGGWRSRSTCCANSGPSRMSRSRGVGIRSTASA